MDEDQPEAVDIWEVLARHLDPASQKPRLAKDIEISSLDWAKTGPRALVARGSVVLGLEQGEADVLPLMDGTRSVGVLAERAFELSGTVDPAGITELVEMLSAYGLLEDSPVDVPAALERALERRPAWLRAVNRFVRTLSVEWSGADRLVRWFYRHGLRRLVNPWGGVLSIVVALGGVAAFAEVVTTRHFHFATISPGWGFVLLMSLNLVIVFIHELGHATAVVHHGKSVRSAGFRIYYGAPAFFVDAPQALLLTRRQRIAQAAAGPWFESVAAGVASVVLWLTPTGWAAPILFRFVVVNYVVLMMNLVPLLELDGYLILSDAIGIPDLRARSLAFLRRGLVGKIRGQQRLTRVDLGLGLYAILGLAFAAGSLVVSGFFWRRTFGGVVSRMWHGGPLGLTLLVILALVIAGPLFQAGIQVLTSLAGQIDRTARRIRFRMEHGWRVEAAEVIDAMPIFDDLAVDVLNELAGRVRLASYGPFEEIVSEGDAAHDYFVIRAGRAAVEDRSPHTGAVTLLRVLGPGEGFGELALMRHSPRTSTVRADGHVETFVVPGGTFDRLLAPRLRLPDFVTSWQELGEVAAAKSLSRLDSLQLSTLLSDSTRVVASPGELLVTEGDRADGFYVLLEGQAEVSEHGEYRRTLGSGDHFGEIALLEQGPRTATVTALTPVRALRITTDAFHSLVEDEPMRDTAMLMRSGALDRCG